MYGGFKVPVDKASQDIARGFQTGIAQGLEADGKRMAPLKKSTLEGPVRRDTDSTIRGNRGDKPLNASGDTARSIRSKKVDLYTWEISSNSDRGDMILSSNAKGGGNGSPFDGDVRKAVRDPLQVSDKQMDTLEDALVDGLDRLLNGP